MSALFDRHAIFATALHCVFMCEFYFPCTSFQFTIQFSFFPRFLTIQFLFFLVFLNDGSKYIEGVCVCVCSHCWLCLATSFHLRKSFKAAGRLVVTTQTRTLTMTRQKKTSEEECRFGVICFFLFFSSPSSECCFLKSGVSGCCFLFCLLKKKSKDRKTDIRKETKNKYRWAHGQRQQQKQDRQGKKKLWAKRQLKPKHTSQGISDKMLAPKVKEMNKQTRQNKNKVVEDKTGRTSCGQQGQGKKGWSHFYHPFFRFFKCHSVQISYVLCFFFFCQTSRVCSVALGQGVLSTTEFGLLRR